MDAPQALVVGGINFFQLSTVIVPHVAEWKTSFDRVVAFQTVSLSFLGKPWLANNLLLNALVLAFACAVLDSTSWSYLCGPALIEPKCLYCWLSQYQARQKRGGPREFVGCLLSCHF